MNYSISNTAEYGGYVSGPAVVGNDSKKAMKKVLENIQSGKFVKDWMNENKSGSNKEFHSMRKESSNHQIEEVGGELRNMMSWLGENKLVDKDKN